MTVTFNPGDAVIWKPGKTRGTVVSFLGVYQSKQNRAELGPGDRSGENHYLVEFELPAGRKDRHGCWESDLLPASEALPE